MDAAIRIESLWPPPAKWTAKSGFQPTRAAARGLSRARRAARTVQASIPSAASTLKIQAAAAADDPATSATASDRSVKAGPYTEVVSRQSAPAFAYAGSAGNSSGVST